MEREDVLKEIDRRIKRLEAEIEIVEERLRYLEELGAPSKYRALRRKDYSVYYILLMGVWILVGFFVLLAIRDRLPAGFKLPLLPYAILAFIIVVVPLAYYLLSSGREEKSPMDELEERERTARLVLSLFYRPFRDAVERNDRKALEGLAGEILENPLLAEAIEKTNEGDPKKIAYALYLYANYKPELEDEVRTTAEALRNKAVKGLLSTLLKD